MPKHRKKTTPELSPWRRIHVDVPAEAADAISGLLVDEGALGLETEDDETRAVPGRAAVLTGRATITATFSREVALEARIVGAVRRMAEFVDGAANAQIEWSDLWPEDWNAIFRQHWKPFRCGTRIWVCPSWERASFHAERVGEGPAPIVLYLDAGMAFGTGTHETTQLCIEAFERAPPLPAASSSPSSSPSSSSDATSRSSSLGRVLDVGTGTGILSIAALKLGATSARGTDIDPVAVAAALENARNNGVAKGFTADARMPDVDGAVYDCVVANILAGTLIELVDPIVASVKPGGVLWLSGVLVEQEHAVRNAYAAKGLVHNGTATKNGWVRIDFTKPAR